jgi:hypothetical protein
MKYLCCWIFNICNLSVIFKSNHHMHAALFHAGDYMYEYIYISFIIIESHITYVCILCQHCLLFIQNLSF